MPQPLPPPSSRAQGLPCSRNRQKPGTGGPIGHFFGHLAGEEAGQRAGQWIHPGWGLLVRMWSRVSLGELATFRSGLAIRGRWRSLGRAGLERGGALNILVRFLPALHSQAGAEPGVERGVGALQACPVELTSGLALDDPREQPLAEAGSPSPSPLPVRPWP